MRYAVINQQNRVRNVIELDDLDAWPIPEGYRILQSDTLNIGDLEEGDPS